MGLNFPFRSGVKLRETILLKSRRVNLAVKKTRRKMRKSFRLKLKPPNDRFFVKKSTNLSIQLKYKMIVK